MATQVAVAGDEHVYVEDPTPRSYAAVGFFFLALGAVAGLLLALRLTWPEILSDVEWLSYGRLQAAFVGTLVFGWLTLSLLGGVFFITPRLTGAQLAADRLARVALLLLAGSVVAGVIGVLVGEGSGRRFFEFPWWADIPYFLGLALTGLVLHRSLSARRERHMYVSLWFFVGGITWMALTFIVGNIARPLSASGIDVAITARFAENGVLFLWPLPLGLGIAYYLVPRLTGNALYSGRLGTISFYAAAATFPWTAFHLFIYGPVPQPSQTIAAVFAIASVLAVAVALANLAMTMQGRWDRLRDSLALRFVVTGAAFFGLTVVQLLAMALRSSSAVVQFTPFAEAGLIVTALGAGTCWGIAFVTHLRQTNSAMGRLGHGLFASGVLTLVGTLWLGGLLAGFTWTAAPTSGEFDNYGEGYVNTVGQLAGFDTVRWIAWAVIVAAVLVLWLALTRGTWLENDLPEPSSDDVDDRGPSFVGGVATAAWVGALLLTVVVPIADSPTDPTVRALTYRDYPAMASGEGLSVLSEEALAEAGLDPRAVAAGRALYIQEGCTSCHTQQVRPVLTDVGLGPVTQAGDVHFESVDVTGWSRTGPDLSFAGTRPNTENPAWVSAHLADPQAGRPWSSMPPYDFLSDAELGELAQYIASLR